MAAYEIWYNLLAQVFLPVDGVEYVLELTELVEGWFSHEVEHCITRMFWSHLKPSTHVLCNQFMCVLSGSSISLCITGTVQKKVITHPAANEAFLYAWHTVNCMINVKQKRVVSVEVRTDARMNTGRAFASFTQLAVTATHPVHVGRRSSKVT